MTTAFRVEAITDVERVRQLRRRWDSLSQHAPEQSPFLSYDFFITWWDAFSNGETPYVVTVWSRDTLVGVAPLAYVRRRTFGRSRTVVNFWADVYSNFTNFVVGQPAANVFDAIVAHLIDAAPPWDIIHLTPMRRDSQATGEFIAALQRHGVRYGIDPSYRSPFLALPATWAELMATRSRSFRESIRRKERKAAAEWNIEVETTSDPARMNDVLAISKQTWQHSTGTSIASTQRLARFYTDLAQRASDRGWLQLAFLHFNGRPVSFEYNLCDGRVLYNLKLGYLQELAGYSPGLILKVRLMEQIFDTSVEEYDFLGAEEPYKLHWTNSVREHINCRVFRKGLELCTVHTVRYRIRPYLREHLPYVTPVMRLVSRSRKRT